VVEEPALVNSDSEGEGWLVKFSYAGALPDSLLDPASYAKYLETDAFSLAEPRG